MSDSNYRPPSAPLSEPAGHIEPRGVAAGRAWQWIVDGFEHFRRQPGAWIGAVLVIVLLTMVMSVVPFVGSIATALMSPIFTGGIMLGCQDQRLGQAFTVGHAFAGFQKNAGNLMLVGVFYFIGIVVLMIIGGIFGAVLVGAAFGFGGDSGNEAIGLMVAVIVLLVLAFMIPLLMAYWFAPALVALDGLSALDAMRKSFSGCIRNIVPFLVYGLIAAIPMLVIGLAFFSMLDFEAMMSGSEPPLGALFGMIGVTLIASLVMAPTFWGSMYSSYLDIFKNNQVN